jgi:penicillin-binding protein 1A
VPPVPFRAPSGIKLVRDNHKSGQPSGGGGSIVEAFKPGQEPAGSVEVMEGGEVAEDGSMPPPPDGYAPPPPPGYGPPPGPPPAPPPFQRGPAPGNDRSLTSGTGGLY